MPKMDILIEIAYNLEDLEKTVIKTNAKKEAIEKVLEAFLYNQIGTGEDKRKANEKNVYEIKIGLDLSCDRFFVKSDTGNEGLTTGIVMQAMANLEKIKILNL